MNTMSGCKYEPVDIQVDNTIETSVTITNFLERYYAAKHEGLERPRHINFNVNVESWVASDKIVVKSVGKDDTAVGIAVVFDKEVSKQIKNELMALAKTSGKLGRCPFRVYLFS